MTPERHAKIQEIFEAAIDLPPSRRTAYLEEICRDDSELRARVALLIEASEEDGHEPSEDTTHAFVKECPSCSRCYSGSTLTCSYDGTPLEPGFPGELLIAGKYLVERRLGKGGMGAVYLAKHTGLEKRFALKLILTEGPISKLAREDFETEARALGRLKHPNIVDVTDYGVDSHGHGLPYLVMEYLEGQTLSDLLRDRGSLPFPEALPILRAVANALDRAHAQSIVHGDLKPSNLFLASRDNSGPVVKIVDFGLARLRGPGGALGGDDDLAARQDRSTANGLIRGTPAYMAPELFRSDGASPASDRFAFGVLSYQVLTGRLPFGAYFEEIREKVQFPPRPPSSINAGLPPELDAPVLQLMKFKPGDRPASAAEAVRSMEQAWLEAERRRWRAEETPRRFGLATIAAGLVVLIAGLAAQLPVLDVWEDRTADARFAMLPKRSPHPRVMVVAMDEATLAQDPRPLADPAWADAFGSALQRIFAAGASAVAIDILLPPSWSRSGEFARAIQQRADRLVLALFSSPSGDVIGTECIAPLTANLLGAERFKNLFGLVNLRDDADGALRRARLAYLDRNWNARPSFAARAAAVAALAPVRPATGSPFRIDYSANPRDVPTLSWKDLDGKLGSTPSLFQDKLVILGADYAGSSDEHRVPSRVSSALIPGVFIEALIVSTIASGLPIHTLGLPIGLALTGLAGYATILLCFRFPHRSMVTLWVAIGLSLAYALVAFAIFRFTRTLLPLVAPELTLILSILVAWGLKSYLRPYPTLENLKGIGV